MQLVGRPLRKNSYSAPGATASALPPVSRFADIPAPRSAPDASTRSSTMRAQCHQDTARSAALIDPGPMSAVSSGGDCRVDVWPQSRGASPANQPIARSHGTRDTARPAGSTHSPDQHFDGVRNQQSRSSLISLPTHTRRSHVRQTWRRPTTVVLVRGGRARQKIALSRLVSAIVARLHHQHTRYVTCRYDRQVMADEQ